MIYLAKFISVLHSGTRTTTVKSVNFNNWENQEALHVVVDVTSGSNLSVTINGHDPESNKDYVLLTSLLPSGTTVLKVGPDYTSAANVAKDYVPSFWNVNTVPSGSTVFSIGASLI